MILRKAQELLLHTELEVIDVYEYGDSVRIKASGLCGEICDIKTGGLETVYIIDQHAYKKTDDADEWLIEARESEIESV